MDYASYSATKILVRGYLSGCHCCLVVIITVICVRPSRRLTRAISSIKNHVSRYYPDPLLVGY
jgi:hypothetical protein